MVVFKMLEIKKRQRLRGCVLVFLLPAIGVFWLIFSMLFFVLGASGDPSSLFAIKSFIDWLLGLFSLLGLVLWPVGIYFLIKGNRGDLNSPNLLSTFFSVDVYDENFDIKNISSDKLGLMKKHSFYKTFSLGLLVSLHIITFGVFSIIYMGLLYDFLPTINRKDFGSNKAIGFLLIPFFNVYWIFVFWLRLINRINFQYRIRGLVLPISKSLAIVMLIFGFIPLLNIISIILKIILICQIQRTVNDLAKKE